MESKLKTIVNGALKYPILLITSGVVALFCLIQFFIQLGNFFNSIGWFFESILWYFSRGNFLSGVGSAFGGMFGLLDTFWYALQFLAVIVLLGMFIMYVTGTLKMTKGSGIILLIAAVVASYIIRPLYEIVNGLPMFGGAALFYSADESCRTGGCGVFVHLPQKEKADELYALFVNCGWNSGSAGSV